MHVCACDPAGVSLDLGVYVSVYLSVCEFVMCVCMMFPCMCEHVSVYVCT